MKRIEFETSKGRFLVVDEKIDLDTWDYKYPLVFISKLSEITEEQASEIVGAEININHSANHNIMQLHHILKSKGIHLFENPFTKPENYDLWAKYGDFTQYGTTLTVDCLRWKESEEKTFYNPYIFKL